MPDPYEWVEESAFRVEYDQAIPPRYRVFAAQSPWVQVEGEPQEAFEATYGPPLDIGIAPIETASENWNAAISDLGTGAPRDWWRVDMGADPAGPSWVTFSHALLTPEAPLAARRLDVLNLRLDGDLGAPPLDEIPETPEWAFLEVSGGGVSQIDVELMAVIRTGGFPPVEPLEVGATWDEEYRPGWMVYRAVGTAGSQGAGGTTSAANKALIQGATPSTIATIWDRSDDVTGPETQDGPTDPGWAIPQGPDADPDNPALFDLTVDYHVAGGALVMIAPGPVYLPRTPGVPGSAFDHGGAAFDESAVAQSYIRGVRVTGVHHHPWSWRWVPKGTGLTRLRQRQTLTGSDSWPLRQRQNGSHSGSWPLRQRQQGV